MTESRIASHDLDADVFRGLVTDRARALGVEVTLPAGHQSEWERRGIEGEILEKVHLRNDLLPARWLWQGADAACAVVRVVVPAANAVGTGFLVTDRVILTNHHVLESARMAAGAYVEFFYEEGEEYVAVGLMPSRLFITNAELDYTFCALTEVQIMGPIELAPNRVTRGERMNIIQHPGGGYKQIAVHDNRVLRVLDTVIRYRTDTMPGSSGSPVFDNEWNLVGLHHSGWMGVCGTATNEAVRIDVILESLSDVDKGKLAIQ